MLLFRILHAVLTSNRPGSSVAADDDKWMKSSSLRSRLGEIVVPSLLLSLARKTSSGGRDDDDDAESTFVACRDEVRSALEEWGECDAFGGPTVYGEYRRIWTAALREAPAASAVGGADGTNDGVVDTTTTTTTADADARSENAKAPTTSSLEGDDAIGGASPNARGRAPGIGGGDSGPDDVTESASVVDKTLDERDESADEAAGGTSSSTPFVDEKRNDKAVRASTRDSVANVGIEIDFEVRLRSSFL
jgi:hypothetical protein